MATTKQKKLAKVIIENAVIDSPLNAGQMLEKVGYSKSVAKAKSADIINSEGVQEALSDYGFNPDNAKMVVAEILLDPETEKNTRISAAKEVFKVFGEYAPEKKLVGTFNLNDEQRDKAKSAIKNIVS